jgi:ABC-type multidrug transport system fused ATPase/permease subunit
VDNAGGEVASQDSGTPLRGSAVGTLIASFASLITFWLFERTVSLTSVLISILFALVAAVLTRWLVSAIDLPEQGSAAWERQARLRTRSAMNTYLSIIAKNGAADPAEEEGRAFEVLNLVQLDQYHSIATRQSKMSFYTAQLAMFFGFILLLVFAIIAFAAPTATTSIVAGALGAFSAALAGYISRTFVHAQDGAANRLRSYFDHPRQTSRYLTAERVLTRGKLTDEQRADVTTALLRGLLAGDEKPAGESLDDPA